VQTQPPVHGPTPYYPINNWILSWRSNRRGWGHIYVDGILRDRQFVAAGIINRSCVFDDWLNTPGPFNGSHQVWIEVVVPEDASVRSAMTTQTFTN
jgi:hypothetical protein